MSLWTLVPPSDAVLIQRLFANGENGGWWPSLRQYAYEDLAGTTAASVDGVVGYRTEVVLGNHAIQATALDKPYLRVTPTTGEFWYDAGSLVATFSDALGVAMGQLDPGCNN